MTFEFRPTTKEERKYCFPQGTNLLNATGSICRISGTFGAGNLHREVYCAERFSPSFREELNLLVSELTAQDMVPPRILCNYGTMQKYCETHRDTFARSSDAWKGYTYSAWSADYAYMILLVQHGSEPPKYHIFCYQRSKFVYHLHQARNGIQFVDLLGNPTFHLDDGDELMIEHRGHAYIPSVSVVRLVSKTSFDCGGILYTPEDLADELDTNYTCAVPMRASLPESCFFYDERSGKLMEIRKGALFMTVSRVNSDINKNWNREHADFYNSNAGLTAAQVNAMYHGVQYGWDQPEADPANYDAEGLFQEQNQ